MTKVCLYCQKRLSIEQEEEYGLCLQHISEIMILSDNSNRDFGLGQEYQILRHSDALDDILHCAGFAEYFDRDKTDEELIGLFSTNYECVNLVSKLYMSFMVQNFSQENFDYIVHLTDWYSTDALGDDLEWKVKIFWPTAEWQSQRLLDGLKNKRMYSLKGRRILLLDYYRTHNLRLLLQLCKKAKAEVVIPVYLTSIS